MSTYQRTADDAAARYHPALDDYDLSKDPRCLWGWGPPSCTHTYGHTCFRALGHPGNCGDPIDRSECPRRRPKGWDSDGRTVANA